MELLQVKQFQSVCHQSLVEMMENYIVTVLQTLDMTVQTDLSVVSIIFNTSQHAKKKIPTSDQLVYLRAD